MNKSLVVIDLQSDITKNYRDIIGNINKAIEIAKNSGLIVVYIKQNNITEGTRTFKAGTRGEAFVPELYVVADKSLKACKTNKMYDKNDNCIAI